MLDCSKRHPSRVFSLLLLLSLLSLAASANAADKPAKPASRDGHPIVAGFERFHAGGADAAKGGRLLLGELNCISCHRPETSQEPRLQRKQAPILDGVGNRVRRSYLRKYLRDPKAIKPGSTMPDLLAGLPEAERGQTIEALVHFLASTGTLRQGRPDIKSIALGKQLFHQVGCVACHGTRDNAGNAAKLLSTSVPLGDLRAKYSLLSLAAFLENPHTVRPSGRMPGILTNQEAKQVANYLLQGVGFVDAAQNMTYAYYEGTWDHLPDFTKMKPLATGRAAGFELSVARRPGDFALRFEGYLPIERAGDYRFHLSSDDGSKLFLDDKLVVANDGVHAPSTASGVVKLTKGVHKLGASVFNAGGGVELRVDLEGPGMGRQDVTPLVILTPKGNPKRPVKTVDPKDDDDFAIQPELATKGRELFTSIGCASCHQLSIDKKSLASSLKASPLAKLASEGGCLAQEPAKGLPRYALSAAQRGALAAAIKTPTPAARPSHEDVIARTMTTLNCYACHQRDKVGGIEESINSLFATTQPEMGEEARIPPPLTGVGAKIRPDYLKQIFNQGSRDRPYMLTHMPRFGEANVPGLAEAFDALDKVDPVAKVTFKEPLSRVKAEARTMVGAQSLGCVKCHTFAGHKAEGVQGIDMLLMTRRLKHDWFYRYLLDPQKLRPGTRMPTAWTNGVTVLTDVLGGSTAEQIDAIWIYLQDGGKAALPRGLNKHYIPLIPDKEAIVYRNFLEGSGSRAIGVGYPEKANLAFDANELRLALLWQGAFIDAARHWTDRGVGYEPPLGDNPVHLPTGVAFAKLSKDDEAWPAKSAKDLGYKFRGYRTTTDERPTFLYSCGDVRIEDFPNGVASKPNPSIRRTLALTAEQPVDNFWLRAAVADKIETTKEKGVYRINGEWTMKIDSATAPRIRKSGGKTELLVPVRFQDGKARIVQEFVW
ncbi:MAG TPA: c-type cytochrome [Gemmataceae bacterium]|nr:c-type cytochrome [Gemmataceae bacterium]